MVSACTTYSGKEFQMLTTLLVKKNLRDKSWQEVVNWKKTQEVVRNNAVECDLERTGLRSVSSKLSGLKPLPNDTPLYDDP